MKNFLFAACTLLVCMPMFAQHPYYDLNKNGHMDVYENRSLPISRRVDDLISQMTLEEKVGQLQMTMGWQYYEREGDEVRLSSKFKQDLLERQLGSTWALMRADPWTEKDFSNGLTRDKSILLTRELQRYVRENTRLGIPFFIAEESPHGLMALEAVVYPTALCRASSFNTQLERTIGEAVGKDVYERGAHIAFGPVADIARDPRWSRMEEGYGEDPLLSAEMSTQYALGLQSSGTISTMKHLSAYGVPEGGHNGASAHVGNRELLSILSYPFMKAVEKGLKSVMTSYNDVDGIPCSGNPWLMKEILRNSWGFRGMVISDLFAINGLVSARMATNYAEAAVAAIRSGVNIDLGASCYAKPLIEAVNMGWVTETEIDEVLRPVLTAKFELGLFDTDFEKNVELLDSVNIQTALNAARESVILLKNENHILPLSKNIRRIAVIGPNADNVYNMLGDYTAPQQPDGVVTILEGIREVAANTVVDFIKGCAIRDTSWSEIEKAVDVAQKADVVVVVLGGSSARDFRTNFKQTGAAEVRADAVSDMECGEGFDRASLKILGHQEALLKAVCATGKPVVLVLVQGRPLNISWANEHVTAILNAWYPGSQGGRAVAEILFGDVNPSGHLPVSYPRNEKQLPVYYNTTSLRHDYTDLSAQPLYPFGYGLSYTDFEYSDAMVTEKDSCVIIDFKLKNIGKYDGYEVVQLYMKDECSSVILPEYQLKQFKKIYLEKNESKNVQLILSKDDFILMNRHLEWVEEPGDYTVRIGSHFGDNRLEMSIHR